MTTNNPHQHGTTAWLVVEARNLQMKVLELSAALATAERDARATCNGSCDK